MLTLGLALVSCSGGGSKSSTSADTAPAAPVIIGFTPDSGVVGTTVTISGQNFSDIVTNNTVTFNGTSATVSASTITAITTTVPSGATSGKITVTTSNGSASSSTDFTVLSAPVITSFTPASGEVGAAVTITGTNLANPVSVKFNGVAAAVNSSSSTRIDTNVPAGATTGSITVTTAGGTASSTTFTVQPTVVTPAAPVILSFTPSAGIIGAAVTISGSNFSSPTVKFNGTSAAISSSTSTSISTSVPTGASSGTITVTTSGGTATSSTSFTVQKAITITGCNPTVVGAGDTLTISGTNFSTILSQNTVTIGGLTVIVTAATANSLTVVVPDGVAIGKPVIVVTTNGATTSNSSSLTVAKYPIIDSFSPASAYGGQEITISGSNFDTTSPSANTISIGGKYTVATAVTSTSLTFRVPSGSATGTTKIAVTSNGLTITSLGSFNVVAAPSDAPSITSFSPLRGPAGTPVTISGSNFGTSPIVKFNGVDVVSATSDGSTITTNVPVGAVTGNITVETGIYFCNSDLAFKVDTIPQITSVYYILADGTVKSNEALINAQITIEGQGFSAIASENVVSFAKSSGTTVAAVNTATTTKLTVTVPSDADAGSYTLGYTNSDSGLSATSSSITVKQAAVTIAKSLGWLESAVLEWTAIAGVTVDSYNVWYQKSGDSTWTKIDTQLIRSYGTYFRADAMGLAGGTYTLRVYGSNGGTQLEGYAERTVTVLAQDRTGFAFGGSTTPGAYKTDGTLKDNAYVLYLTNNNKDTITMSVVTSSKGTTTSCTGIDNILLSYKKGLDTRPLCIRMIGNVTDPATLESGDLIIENDNTANGVTFEGVGNDAVANGWGIRLKNANYCELRNIAFMNCDSDEGDNVGLQQGNNYIWVHNCDMFYGNAGSDADQIKGDGALDTKKSNYCTMSYNHFWDNGKCNLLGLSESVKSYESGAYYITYHHNWYDHSDSRHPRTRYYNAHVYNNYYDGNAKYGAGSTLGSSVFMQNNYFRNCKDPMMISMQGTDVYSTGTKYDPTNLGTFSDEDGGIIKACGNVMIGTYTFIPYGATDIVTAGTSVTAASRGITTTIHFDAYVVDSPSTTVPSSITSFQGANYYSNFDTNGTSLTMYSWTPDTAEDSVTKTKQYAGRVEGGDLKWTFDNSVEDTNSTVITALKNAITVYAGTLVSVQGDSSTTTPSASASASASASSTGSTGSQICTFSSTGGSNSFFAITGNVSGSKGTCTVNSVDYTYCLKMESATNITFTTTSSMTLTLVFGGTTTASGKAVKIDGTSYTTTASGSNYVVTQTLAAGSHAITKGDSINLFYISLE